MDDIEMAKIRWRQFDTLIQAEAEAIVRSGEVNEEKIKQAVERINEKTESPVLRSSTDYTLRWRIANLLMKQLIEEKKAQKK